MERKLARGMVSITQFSWAASGQKWALTSTSACSANIAQTLKVYRNTQGRLSHQRTIGIKVTMIETSFIGIEARSYDERHIPDRHDFAQLVLPLTGLVQLDIAGQQGKLDLRSVDR